MENYIKLKGDVTLVNKDEFIENEVKYVEPQQKKEIGITVTLVGKKRTLKEIANEYKFLNKTKGFILVAKFQQEQDKKMYSEEEVEIIITKLMNDVHCGDLCYGDNVIDFKLSPRQWLEQFKNK